MARIAAHLNAEVILIVTVAIGIYNFPLPPPPYPIPHPPFSPSLMSLMVSVDVKHHVYLHSISANGSSPELLHFFRHYIRLIQTASNNNSYLQLKYPKDGRAVAIQCRMYVVA